jgi:hypothetical protein
MKRFKSPYADIFKKKKETVDKPKPEKGVRYRFEIALDTLRDRELIEYLETLPNKSEYIRELIREDIDAM